MLLPVMLTLVGVLIDVARLYHAWLNLEAATRDAAQYLATSNPDPCDNNYSGTPPADMGCFLPATADQKAKYLLELATGTTFTISASQTACTSAMVTTTYSENSSSSVGGSPAYPVGISTVTACLPFKTLFAYPLLTNGGSWTLRSEETYRSLVGR
ncbi:MAG: pilus assembly protein [Chloroflexota bacterium]|nr:pilus assembly protein [Chloroflexota bacterium]